MIYAQKDVYFPDNNCSQCTSYDQYTTKCTHYYGLHGSRTNKSCCRFFKFQSKLPKTIKEKIDEIFNNTYNRKNED